MTDLRRFRELAMRRVRAERRREREDRVAVESSELFIRGQAQPRGRFLLELSEPARLAFLSGHVWFSGGWLNAGSETHYSPDQPLSDELRTFFL